MKRCHLKHFVLVLLIACTLTNISCGGNDSNLYAVINNKQVSLPINGVDVVANGITDGQVLQGQPGLSYAGASLTVLISFLNGNIVDRIVVYVQDVGTILLGQTYYVDGGNLKASMTLNGQDQPVSQGSFVIKFDQLGVASGQTVSFDFQVNSSIAFLNGHAEGTVQNGY